MGCQIDFGELGLLLDPATGRRRKVHALVFTAVYSGHMFVVVALVDETYPGGDETYARQSPRRRVTGNPLQRLPSGN
jgi:hypothetical protein